MMRLSRVSRVLLCGRAIHLVRKPFLLIRHRVVHGLESWNELLQVPGVDLAHLLVRLHILHRAIDWTAECYANDLQFDVVPWESLEK